MGEGRVPETKPLPETVKLGLELLREKFQVATHGYCATAILEAGLDNTHWAVNVETMQFEKVL